MAEHGWSVLCSRVIVDRETNQASLIDACDVFLINGAGIEELLLQAKADGNAGISVPSKLSLATWWYRADPNLPESQTARIQKISPSGEIVFEQEFAVSLEENSGARTFFHIPLFRLSEFGRYYFVIDRLLNEPVAGGPRHWERVAKLPLDVRIGKAESNDPTAPELPSSQPRSAASS